MKIRSFLLVACIVVVPLIAMFSHRIPPGARAAVGAFVRDVVAPARPPHPAPLPHVAAEPLPTQAAAAPVVAAAAAEAPLPGPDPAAAGASVARLRDLGAVAIECRPLPGAGGHVATCRCPIDGAGQLERVFQATGADAASATDNLLRDVNAWRRAGAARAPATMRF